MDPDPYLWLMDPDPGGPQSKNMLIRWIRIRWIRIRNAGLKTTKWGQGCDMNLYLILFSDLGDSRDEDERIEDGSLEHGGPQQHLLPPHHFCRLPHLQYWFGSRSMQWNINGFKIILSTYYELHFSKRHCTNQGKRLFPELWFLPLTNRSGTGSCSFVSGLQDVNKK